MSLLTGMNDMLKNKAALEAAQDLIDFEEDIALEADELIDTMVDGMATSEDISDDIDEIENEFEEDEAIMNELDSEDDFTDTVGNSANEAAALTGMSFLSSLVLDTDDPITTKNGSIGYDDSEATHKDNFSDDFDDNNDPITTKNGSIGYKGSANPENNSSITSKNGSDPITTKNGSIGASSTAKDPAVESALFFGELLGNDEVVTEGLIKKFAAKKEKKYNDVLDALGLSKYKSFDDEFNKVFEPGSYDKASKMINKFLQDIDKAKAKLPEDDKNRKAAERMFKSYYTVAVSLKRDALEEKYVKSGMSKKDARKKAKAELRAKATESFIIDCLDMMDAFEAACCGDGCDPEATKDGSIGASSKATFDGNFSDGKEDKDDPIVTKDGSEGQEDSAATFDKNFSDGIDDDDDPIDTVDGSVGQKDSTAKDPVIESSTDSELEKMNASLDDDFEDDDDDDEDDDYDED